MNIFSYSSSYRSGRALAVMAVCAVLTTHAWGQSAPYQPLAQSANCGQINPATGTPYSCYTNKDSIANTRHSMRQPWAINLNGPAFPVVLDIHNNARNDYQEICVYCHTPHGANTTIAAPLWNRTIRATTYSVYNSGSLTQTVLQPGGSSLSCLSCHDGQTAIDSIINMPGSGRYNASQQTTQNIAFLNAWDNRTSGYVPGSIPDTASHKGMNSNFSTAGYSVGNGTGSDGIGCLACHSPDGVVSGGADHDMRLAFIGMDLTNDHPVGVTFPAANGPGTGFNTPIAAGAVRYFDMNGDGALDKGDVRMYSPGAGGASAATSATVECASCHDPHGVPSAGPGSTFKPLFLRVDNNSSALCLACHIR